MSKKVMLKHCISCGVEMTPENRSKHQPGIRCLACYAQFSDEVKKMLTHMLIEK
uniref:Uncharacterized protein n=1 Tax=viral metagenome TaxID=1070528 RepID=A0A6M3JFU0_9ZZZZ